MTGLHFVVVSSAFAEADVRKAEEIVTTTRAKSCVLMEAAALRAMVELRLRTTLISEPSQLQRLLIQTRILRESDVSALDR